jgi:hypothetical protein
MIPNHDEIYFSVFGFKKKDIFLPRLHHFTYSPTATTNRAVVRSSVTCFVTSAWNFEYSDIVMPDAEPAAAAAADLPTMLRFC